MKKTGKDNSKLKSEWRDRLGTALTIAPTLAVVLMVSVYNLSLGQMGVNITSSTPMMLSILALLSLVASTVLAVVHKKKFTLSFLAILFLLCFMCYLSFYLKQSTDIYDDGFFQKIMLVFNLPVWAYMPIAMVLSSVPAIPALIITAILFCGNGVCLLVLKLRERRYGTKA